MKQPSVLLISYHFYPSFEIGARRVTALARFLAAAGIKVIVVSEFGGKDFTPGMEIWPGVIAAPVPQPPGFVLDRLVALKRWWGRPNGSTSATASVTTTATPKPLGRNSGLRTLFFRIAYFVDAYKRWSMNASQAAVQIGRKCDARLVISSGPPHSMLLAGARTGRKLAIPHIADLRDPWTDHSPPSANSPRGIELWALRWLEEKVLRSAAAITSTGSNVAEILSTRYPEVRPRTHVIRNGFDGEVSKIAAETRYRLSILFAGELYVKRNPFPLFTALDNILARPDIDAARISMTFMGRCATYNDESLTEWLRGKRAESVVKIFPQMPAAAVEEAAKEATVLLNFAQQQPLSVPAKTFEHLANGREILLICEDNSETAQLVAGIPGVLQVDQADPGKLEATLLDLYRRHVVEGKLTAPDETHVMRFSRTVANEQFLKVMESIAKLR